MVPVLAVIAASLGAPGCKDKGATPEQGAGTPPPPPPTETVKAGACAAGGGQVADPISAPYFPRTLKVGAVDWCIDPQGETRTYGEKGKLTMDEVCTTAVDGECEVYKRYGLKRFVSLRYVDGGGNGGSVEIYLSQYADPAGAYGMFTKRVVADGDPADPSAPKPLEAGAGAAMGTGRAYVWRGDEVAELQYINENESPEALAKSSDAVLAPLAKQIGAKLPGALEKPASAAALPTAGLVGPNAITYFTKDALGLPNVGAGAMGFYKDGERRYRLAAIQKGDADQAKDVMKTIRSRPGALPVPGPADDSVHVVLQASPESAKVEWLFTRKGALVAGAGDEELAIKPGDAPEKQNAARLSKDEATAKLKAWLNGAAAPSSASGAPAPSAKPGAPPKTN
jgi:hypothetical protein